MSFKNYETNDYMHELDLLSSRTYCIFHILREVGVEENVSKYNTSILDNFFLKIYERDVDSTTNNGR